MSALNLHTFRTQHTRTEMTAEAPNNDVKAATGHDGDYYFDSYGHYGIHMEMLKDTHRTESYRNAIMMNPHMFKGKVVLDVGCGTGILSMFAARAGAKRVVSVECSSIAHQARQIVKENNLENVITILHGKMEEVSMPEGVDKVDIIISEWMGYFLLYESMLNSVLYARDKFGAPDVKLLPSHANMYASGIHDPQYIEDRFNCWDNVMGFNFSYFKRLSFIEPLIDSVDNNQVATDAPAFFRMDLAKVTEKELSFTSTFVLTATRNDTIHAIAVHFDTPFLAGHDAVILDTAPWTQTTHWRQTVFYLYNPIMIMKGEKIHCKLTSAPNSGNPRDLDIRIKVDFDGAKQVSHFEQDYRVR